MAAAEDLIGLVARLALNQLVAPSRAALKRRIAGIAVCGVLAAVAGIAALTWASVALWLWLATQLPPAAAAAICAGVLLLIALLLGIAAARIARPTRSATLTGMLGSKELSGAVEKHLPELVIAAAIGGLLFGLRRRK